MSPSGPPGLGPLHRVRPYCDTDEAYVLVSWLAEAVRSPTYSGVDRDLAFRLLRPHVRALLDRLGHAVSVACPVDRDEPIEAFCLSRGPVLYHLHVKGPFRGQGLMTGLLALHGFDRGSRVIAATDTSDLRGVMARGLYDVAIRPELLLIEGP